MPKTSYRKPLFGPTDFLTGSRRVRFVEHGCLKSSTTPIAWRENVLPKWGQRSVPALAAAAVVLLFLGFAYYRLFQAPTTQLAEGFLREHLRYEVARPLLEQPGSDPVRISVRLQRQVDFPLKVPDLAEIELTLVGGRALRGGEEGGPSPLLCSFRPQSFPLRLGRGEDAAPPRKGPAGEDHLLGGRVQEDGPRLLERRKIGLSVDLSRSGEGPGADEVRFVGSGPRGSLSLK